MSFFKWFPVPKYLLLATANIPAVESASELKNFSPQSKTSFANATLPDEKTYLFTAVVDSVSDEGLGDAVAFIIEENVPVSLKESVFSYEVIERSEGKIKVAVTVVPKTVINDQIKLFESAGITIVSFDTESQIIARSIIPRGDKRAYLIINMLKRKTSFYVVEKGVVQFSTTIGHTDITPLRQPAEIKAKVEEVLSFWTMPIEEILLYGASPNKAALAKLLESDKNIKYV